MLSWLELMSFHLAVFVAASVFYLFQSLEFFSAYGTSSIVIGWLTFCGLIVIFISAVSRAYSPARWSAAHAHGASITILIGHLAPVAASYLYYAMHKAGTGSGMLFLPIIGWAALFYGVGILLSVRRLFQSSERNK